MRRTQWSESRARRCQHQVRAASFACSAPGFPAINAKDSEHSVSTACPQSAQQMIESETEMKNEPAYLPHLGARYRSSCRCGQDESTRRREHRRGSWQQPPGSRQCQRKSKQSFVPRPRRPSRSGTLTGCARRRCHHRRCRYRRLRTSACGQSHRIRQRRGCMVRLHELSLQVYRQ